jgi:hypothetical protein
MGGAASDDQQEREDFLMLQGTGKAMERRIESFAQMPWDTPERLQGFVHEIEEFIRQAATFEAKAYVWRAKDRPLYSTELQTLTAYLQKMLGEYQEYLRRKEVFVGAMATSVVKGPQYQGPDQGQRMRWFMNNRCVCCGSELPNFRVQICPNPLCRGWPYM